MKEDNNMFCGAPYKHERQYGKKDIIATLKIKTG